MNGRRALPVALLMAALGLVATPVAAQNGFSFLDAARSPVDYRLAVVAPRTACRDLQGLSGGGMMVVAAESVPASDATPAFCRVLGVIQPEIQFEVALPAAWNRRLYMRGNGGFAGEALDAAPRVAQRNAAVRHGFVAVQTNTGHDAEAEPLATFGAQSLQKRIDYAFRAVHTTVEAAKRLAQAYYDRPVAFSYWDGCSTGGRQALMSAQRFPGDFDGIIAGAPVLNFTDTMVWNLWNARALAAAPLSLEKLRLVADAVYRRCDARDGSADGLLDDPRTCDFDPARDVPACAVGQDGPDCLTEGQAAALKAIYRGPISQGKAYFVGQPVGAEKAGRPALGGGPPASGWDGWLVTSAGKSRQLLYGESFLRFMAYPKAEPTLDWQAFDFDKDPGRMSAIRGLLDARNPDLAEFRGRGGKLIMYWGWADTALTPLMGIDYYERVTATMGPGTRDFFRLFMVPGMFHCRGGFGPDRLDALTPLINWVEGGRAPDSIVASQEADGAIVRTRPLCPYPQVARYTGSGSLDQAASFACRDPS
jgi:Tannase and feruloyl esterase